MGKIKNFVTGLFSKKKPGEDEEIIQIQPVDEPERYFIEHESRYDTPDYQAFLQDMGYINVEETRGTNAEGEKADDDGETSADDVENAVADIDGETIVNNEGIAENPENLSACEVDQDFIDEGVAELGVNDVWPEEEEN
jgi:hypothetical protein